MRAMFFAVLSAWAAGAAADPESARIVQVRDEQALKESLLALAQERLEPVGIQVVRDGASLSLSRVLDGAKAFEIHAAWLVSSELPQLPLRFDLISVDGRAEPTRAMLAVITLRTVWVAARRLRKGSLVSCEDIRPAQRRVRTLDAVDVNQPCGDELAALREFSEGDVVHANDLGRAPAVMAGQPVRLSVTTNAIEVTANAIALADAYTGDRIEVRLPRPTRVLSARVTGPGTAQLLDGAP